MRLGPSNDVLGEGSGGVIEDGVLLAAGGNLRIGCTDALTGGGSFRIGVVFDAIGASVTSIVGGAGAGVNDGPLTGLG